MAEWLRRLIRNQMGFTRVGSNPTAVEKKKKKKKKKTKKQTNKVGWPSWSKAADLSSVIYGCVGSNPTPTKNIFVYTKTKTKKQSCRRSIVVIASAL